MSDLITIFLVIIQQYNQKSAQVKNGKREKLIIVFHYFNDKECYLVIPNLER